MTTTTARAPAPAVPPPAPGTDGGGAGERALVVVAVLVALASAAGAWSVAGAPPAPGFLSAVRVVVAVLAAATLPGIPVVLLLRPASRALGASLAVGVSLAVTVLASYGTLLAGWWHPLVLQEVLAGVTLALSALAWRSAPPGGPGGVRSLAGGAAGAVSRHSGPLGALALAVVLFVEQTRTLDVSGAGALGIITQVRWTYLAALVLVAAVLVLALRGPRPDHLVLGAGSAVLVLVTTTLVGLSDGETSVPTGWVHRGLIDMIARGGQVPPPIDARIDWAGFFAAGAHLDAVAGLADSSVLLLPATVFFGVLGLAPLFVIGRAVTGSARTAWIGVLLDLLVNWYQQDYFAPQALALFWYTTVLATLLWWWRAARGPETAGSWRQRLTGGLRRTPGRPPGVGPGRAVATEAVLLLMLVALVLTHQLTPLVAVAALLLLAATGTTRFRFLWLATAMAFTAWFSFGAVDYWMGHLSQTLGDVGKVGSTLQGGVASRVGTDPQRQAMQYLRLGSSGVLGVLALVGWWLRRGRPGWLVSGLLAGAPFGLVLVQSYGGEVVIRCFVLASPLLAPLAASLLVRAACAVLPRTARTQLPRRAVTVATVLVLLCAVVLTATRGLNTAFERTTSQEVAVADQLLASVPSGTTIAAWGNAAYLTSARTVTAVHIGLDSSADPAGCQADLAACTLAGRPEYVLLTPTQQWQGRLQEGMAAGWLDDGRAELLASGEYVVQVEAASVTVLRRSDVDPVEGSP